MAAITKQTIARAAQVSIGGKKTMSRALTGKLVEARDYMEVLAADLEEVGDAVEFGLRIPSNALISEVLFYHEDIDVDATETLDLDFGLFAVEKFTSTTSASETIHAQSAVLDADLLVDGLTGAGIEDAVTKLTSLPLDAATAGPLELTKPLWEMLGYDFDPRTQFGIIMTAPVAAATGQAATVLLVVRYCIN